MAYNEYMSETPVSEIKTIKTGDFDPSFYTMFRETIEVADTDTAKIISQLDTAKNALDLGSGSGNSAVGLTYLCPNLEEVTAVDIQKTPDPSKLAPIKLITRNDFIKNFVKTTSEKYDVINFGSVPDHNLKTDEDYQKLANITTNNGFVVETGDTLLNENEMNKHFQVAFKPIWSGHRTQARIWQRIEPQQTA